MPIYEFRCTECHEISEFLFTSDKDRKEMKCPQCGSEELERVLSTTNYAMGGSSGAPRPSVSSKTCAEGTCSTLEIPGGHD